jgi:hypothetical protein
MHPLAVRSCSPASGELLVTLWQVAPLYDAARLKAAVETIPIEDGRLRSVWPDRITRIVLKVEKPLMKDARMPRVEPAKEN